VAVALAGTLFFNASVSQARSQVAIALLVTMAPFAVLAPLIGPLLDRAPAGPALHPGRHAAGPRAAVLGDGGRGVLPRLGHPAAGRVSACWCSRRHTA
jgi:hypothetical protein